LLFVLPALAVLVVLWGILGAGSPRPVRAVQVLGGPTRGVRQLSLLLRAVTSDGARARPLAATALRVVARTSSRSATWEGQTSASGYAEARLEFGVPLEHAPELRVESAETSELLAAGTPSLSAEEWRSGARRQGGWLPGQGEGTLLVRVAPGEGAIAVPFATEVLVRVTPRASAAATAPSASDARGTPGVRLELELTGADVSDSERGRALLTDAAGGARLRLAPSEHAVTARIRATSESGDEAQWYGALPVVPGALRAALDGAELVVSSPIARDEAFVSIVTESERLAGAVVALTADDAGASGRLALQPSLVARLGGEPAWAVVSSEYDKRSPAVVGWPLAPHGRSPSEPVLTFDVADRLLVDGLPGALATEQRERLARRRTALGLLVALGIAMTALLGYELRRRRTPRADGPELALEPRGWLIGVAIACVALAVAALSVFGWLAR
jgi:hypothetical protein